MSVQEKVRWKNWADRLRQEMMTGLQPEVTKTVDAIAAETATSKAESTLHSTRFWKSCQEGKSPNDVLTTAGFIIDFESEEDRTVQQVTLKLNATWMTILQRVIDRSQPRRSG